MFDFGEPLDLSNPTHLSELGPVLAAEARAMRDVEFEESEEFRSISATNMARCQAASINAGSGARHLGGWLHDGHILSSTHQRDTYEIMVSDQWTGWLARDYADRTGHPKYGWRRCNPVVPIGFKFLGVINASCHRIKSTGSGELVREACVIGDRKAREWLNDHVLFASPERIQIALHLWTWMPYVRWPRHNRDQMFVIDAHRMIVHDRRRRAWRRMFGKASLEIFDAADEIRLNRPGEIYERDQVVKFFDDCGLAFRKGISRL